VGADNFVGLEGNTDASSVGLARTGPDASVPPGSKNEGTCARVLQEPGRSRRLRESGSAEAKETKRGATGDEKSEHPVRPAKQGNRPNGTLWRKGDAVNRHDAELLEER
jgi:hypothetical protein